MFRLQSRSAHYIVLAAAHLLITLPNLGAHSLWDMDEGVNAEAGREMLESGNWITPHFNYQIRSAKPALLYWLMAGSYQVFGVNEFAARLPSVLCGLGSVLVTYELGRRLFSPSTGLLSGIALASCIEFCLISHAATPDPPLIFFFVSAMFVYWIGSEGERRWWFIPFGMLTGLATLTKGPIGLGLPGLIILLHLLWTRRLNKLWDHRLLLGALMFLLVAGPWYGMVTLDTKGKWTREFIMHDNLNRMSTPAENHKGGFYYHALLLLVLFVPWSVFLPDAIWQAVRAARKKIATVPPDEPDEPNRYRFLLVWFLAVLVLFSIAATKLPNYVLPLYPAIAIMTGRWLDRWRLGKIVVSRRLPYVALAFIGLFGLIYGVAMLVMSGTIKVPFQIKGLHPIPSFVNSTPIALVPIAVAIAAWRYVRAGAIDRAIAIFSAGAVLLLALTWAIPVVTTQEWRPPKYFAEEVGLRQTDRDIRIAGFHWMRQSMVFYARREVTPMREIDDLNEFLSVPRPAYAIMRLEIWEIVATRLKVPVRVIARRFEMLSRGDVIVIANEYVPPD